MQKTVKVTVLAALLAFTTAQIKADQTNLVQEFNIQLTGVSQGATSTTRNVTVTQVNAARVDTRDVINALGAATGNSFSRAAKLLVITALPQGWVSVVVQDGTTRVDVSWFFLLEQESGQVSSSTVNLRTGRGSSTSYGIERFALSDAGGYPGLSVHFDVQGIATDQTNTENAPSRQVTADVAGAGDRAGNLVILQGTIRIHGFSLEVVADGPAPGV